MSDIDEHDRDRDAETTTTGATRSMSAMCSPDSPSSAIDSRGRLIFPHTEVDPAFRGRGIAQQVVAGAMADVARRGETVIPHCPVVAGYLRKNEVPGLDIIWPSHPHPE